MCVCGVCVVWCGVVCVRDRNDSDVGVTACVCLCGFASCKMAVLCMCEKRQEIMFVCVRVCVSILGVCMCECDVASWLSNVCV